MLPYDNMPLSFAVADFHFRALQRIVFDKYPGFIVRSGFGAALKKLCLFKAKQIPCRDCYLNDRCPYSYIFETPNQNQANDFTAENFPHPFVFYPHFFNCKTIEPGEPFTLSITLFGKGTAYLMYYILAFELLGNMGLGRDRSNFKLESVSDNFADRIVYRDKDKTLHGQLEKRQLKDFTIPTKDTLIVHFITPTKLCENNRTVQTLSADLLIRSLFRRASLLAWQHENVRWEIDFRSQIDRFVQTIQVASCRLDLRRYDRYSSRQGQNHPLFAFTGSVSLTGDLKDYGPLLYAGSLMHIGNSTSQGFGKYEIEKG